ncbi:F-actin-uncapping protein LRRC16A-like isoform X2 [Paramacrobiotus metropolitanus]|uniref:F-actin-uncapping protein LRRC16A-like isoform X2 n=1 Tax=Paramacrobiotus metropolitanus TaxID=2943436 RepID=UPI00244654EC|nr:F-actin-uncapping protein LRRC16A-like isoform X2 [Paramacrobiotus metropolitanus]
MDSEREITQELTDSIREVIGRKVKISMLSPVRWESKPDKYEQRILAFTACRLFILTAKVPSKIDWTFNYLDLDIIESKKSNQFFLTVDGKIHKFYTNTTTNERVDMMIMHLVTAVKSIFPAAPIERIVRKIDLLPYERLQNLQNILESLEIRDCGPCGGYSRMYACMCDYHCLPYREEVAWDVDTIYHAHNTREFCLQDFDHLEPRDLIPIISALEHNTWFTRLKASNIKLLPEAAEQIIRVMKKSTSLEELYMDNIGMKGEFVHKLSMALIANSCTAVHSLNLANNLIEDKGLSSLCGFVAKASPIAGANHLSAPICKATKGLIALNLARTVLSSKGVNAVAHALTLNKFMATTLKTLSFAENSLRDDISHLLRFLGQPNTLTHLDLSGTECNLDNLFLALSTGCHTHLSHLNVSRNVFAAKKKDVSSASSQPVKQFFTSAKSLKSVDLSSTRLSSDILKSLLLGFASNAHLSDVKLNLSGNDFKSSHATQIMETCLPDIPCISSLDLSECNLDHEFSVAVLAIARNSHLRELNLARNFQNVKPKNLPQLLNALVHLIHDEDSKLQSLSLSECRLKSGAGLVLSALGSNQYLKTIDICGNQIGDAGARIFAKALQVNAKLETIILDNNSITHTGYQDLAWALEKNHSIRHIPYPVFDAAASMKVVPEKFATVLNEIEKLLWRNQEPQTKCNERLIRLKQGVVFSNSQQMVDQLICQVQDGIDTLKRCPQVEELDTTALELEGNELVTDADRFKQFLHQLHESTNDSSEYTGGVGNLLEYFVSQLNQTVDMQLRDTIEKMCIKAEELYPQIFRRKKSFKGDLLASARIPQDFLTQCIMRQLAGDVEAKMSEVVLCASSRLSDRVLEDIISSMSSCHNHLSNAIRLHAEWYNSHKASPHRDQKQKSSAVNGTSETIETSKPRSFFTRKINLRPQSIAGNDVDLIAIEEALKLESVREVPPSPTEIPQEEPRHLHKLEHLNKSRPKPKRNRPISKPPMSKSSGDIPPIDDGLGNFFALPELNSGHPNRLSWNKADAVQSLPVFMASPSVARKELVRPADEVVKRTFEPVVEEVERNDTKSSETGAGGKAPFGLSERGFTADIMAEMRAKQEARASGIFNLNVNNGGNVEPVSNGRSKSPPPPTTPKPRSRIGGLGKSLGAKSSEEHENGSSTSPPSPTTPLSNTPDSLGHLDTASIGSDSGVMNDSGSHKSVRALVSSLEHATGDDVEAMRKGASLPRTVIAASVTRSKSMRSAETPEQNNVPAPSNSGGSPPTPSRPMRTLKLKDRVKSLFNDSSKDVKAPTAADGKTKVIEF